MYVCAADAMPFGLVFLHSIFYVLLQDWLHGFIANAYHCIISLLQALHQCIPCFLHCKLLTKVAFSSYAFHYFASNLLCSWLNAYACKHRSFWIVLQYSVCFLSSLCYLSSIFFFVLRLKEIFIYIFVCCVILLFVDMLALLLLLHSLIVSLQRQWTGNDCVSISFNFLHAQNSIVIDTVKP